MRPIKFRVWDTRGAGIGGITAMKELDPYDAGPALSGDVPELIVMQFTGLHDKNGKEIWEGDIVACEECGHNSEVKWIDDMGAWSLHRLNLVLVSSHVMEVLGNIYENPELLRP